MRKKRNRRHAEFSPEAKAGQRPGPGAETHPPASFPWSLRLSFAEIPAAGRSLSFAPDASACAALAERFGLDALVHCSAQIDLQPVGRTIRIHAVLDALIIQKCVATLESVNTRINTEFSLDLRPATENGRETSGALTLDASSVVEPLQGDCFDLGEILAQELGLEIPAYPRSRNSVPGQPRTEENHETGPFTRLKERLPPVTGPARAGPEPGRIPRK